MDTNAVVIMPTLNVSNGTEAIEFYKKAFGATQQMASTDPDGKIVAVLSVGGAQFVVADESPEHKNFSPVTLGGTPVRIGLQVSNPDAFAATAIAAGAIEVYPVADQSYGYRLGHIADPFGHQWEIFKPLH